MLPALAKPGSSSTSDEEECEVCGEKSNETEKLSDWVLSLLSGGDETDLGLQTEDDVLQSLMYGGELCIHHLQIRREAAAP